MSRELPGVFCAFSNHTSNGFIWQHIVLYSLMETSICCHIWVTDGGVAGALTLVRCDAV